MPAMTLTTIPAIDTLTEIRPSLLAPFGSDAAMQFACTIVSTTDTQTGAFYYMRFITY